MASRVKVGGIYAPATSIKLKKNGAYSSPVLYGKVNGVYQQVGLPRAMVGNRAISPYTNTSSASNVRTSSLMQTVSSLAGFSYIQITWPNFYLTNGGEPNAAHAITVGASVLYNNQIYPCTFAGSSSVTCPVGGFVRCDYIAGLVLPANAQYWIITRTVGASGTLNRLTSHGTQPYLQEGIIMGTSEATNYLDGSFGRGRTGTFVRNPGTGFLTAGTITPGTGYTSGCNVYAVDPIGRVTAVVGNTNGAGTQLNITNGSSRAWSSSTYCVISGGGSFGQNTAVYGPCLITGIPTVATISRVLIGDSIMRGFSSSDGIGDLQANYGVIERAIHGSGGFMSMALSGNTASAFSNVGAHARQYEMLRDDGVVINRAVINLGTNDIAQGYSAATVANANGSAQVAGYLAARGIAIDYVSLMPRVTGTYADLAGQTPVSGFGDGGERDVYNNRGRGGNLPYQTGLIDLSALVEAPSDHTRFIPNYTGDGIHLLPGTPIPTVAAALTLPGM